MTDDGLSALHAYALTTAKGDDPWTALKRRSLESSAAQIPELRAAPELVMVLSDPARPGALISARQAGDMLERLQRAIARLTKGRRTHALSVSRLRSGDFEFARLEVAGAVPGSLAIRLGPAPQPVSEEDSAWGIQRQTPWVDLALRDLLTALPESPEDDDAVDSIQAAEPVLRRSIADLVVGRPSSTVDVSFHLRQVQAESVRSVLSAAQTKRLQRDLAVTRQDRLIEHRQGRLDGLRTKRRIFYLETPGQREIHGLIDEDLMPSVREYLDRVVDVALEVVVTRTRAGQAGHRTYRLINIGSQGSLTSAPE